MHKLYCIVPGVFWIKGFQHGPMGLVDIWGVELQVREVGTLVDNLCNRKSAQSWFAAVLNAVHKKYHDFSSLLSHCCGIEPSSLLVLLSLFLVTVFLMTQKIYPTLTLSLASSLTHSP